MVPVLSNGAIPASNVSIGNNGPKPWDDLPNPFGFPTFGEAAKGIHYQPVAVNVFGKYTPKAGSKLPARRTAIVGRDWLGVGFEVGDLLLAQSAGNQSIFEADKIVLDEEDGTPYLDFNGNLVRNRNTGEIFSTKQALRRPSGQDFQTSIELHPIDYSWLGVHLGIVSLGGATMPGLSHDYERVALQSFRVRVKPIDASDGSRKRNFPQSSVTVYGNSMDRATLENYMAAKELPLMAI